MITKIKTANVALKLTIELRCWILTSTINYQYSTITIYKTR